MTTNINTNTNYQNSQSREGTITSYEDIRKIYLFQPDIIGHGQFGAVRLATQIKDPSRKFAIKTISKEKVKRDLQLLKIELEIFKTLDHPNIIKFYETYQDQKFFHLVMEYCQGGELFERIVEKGHFSEKETVQLMQKIFSAVKYLHENGIIHRDLKPENFLYLSKSADSEIKIIDFGLSLQRDNIDNEFIQEKSDQIVGTALYISPEVLDGIYDFKCDTWALGVLTYILLSGQPPFKGKNNDELFEQIKSCNIPYEKDDWKLISKNGQDFVQKLLVKDPKQRLSASQALNHPWLKQIVQDQQEEDKAPIDPQIINMMKNFRSAGKFKQEVLKLLVNQLSETEIKKLRSQFRRLDRDHTGQISIQELRSAMRKIGHNETDCEIQNMMKTFTLNENAKTISYTTFIGACLDKNTFMTSDRLYQIFKQFDIDNTGMITTDNLREVMARNGRRVDQQDLQNLIMDFDLSNDNVISWEEFLRIMTMEKEEDLQSVKESWNNIDIQTTDNTAKRNKNASYGQLGIEVSNLNQTKNTREQIELEFDNQEINVVQIERDRDSNNQQTDQFKCSINSSQQHNNGNQQAKQMTIDAANSNNNSLFLNNNNSKSTYNKKHSYNQLQLQQQQSNSKNPQQQQSMIQDHDNSFWLKDIDEQGNFDLNLRNIGNGKKGSKEI